MSDQFKDLMWNWFIIELKICNPFRGHSAFRDFGKSNTIGYLIQIIVNFEVDYGVKVLEKLFKVVKS